MEQVIAFVANVEYNLILGIPQRAKYNPQICYDTSIVIIDLVYYTENYNSSYKPIVALLVNYYQRQATIEEIKKLYSSDVDF